MPRADAGRTPFELTKRLRELQQELAVILTLFPELALETDYLRLRARPRVRIHRSPWRSGRLLVMATRRGARECGPFVMRYAAKIH